MKKEYIRIKEMENLFSLIPDLKNMKLSLSTELKKLSDYAKDNENDYIESMTFGSCELSDMPHANTNETSDKTASTALLYQQQINSEAKEVKEASKQIVKEIYCIEIVLDKIEIALNSLGKIQKEILDLKYWQNNTWGEIIDKLKKNNSFYSKWQIQEIVKKSIRKINIISMIDIEAYNKVLRLVERDTK